MVVNRRVGARATRSLIRGLRADASISSVSKRRRLWSPFLPIVFFEKTLLVMWMVRYSSMKSCFYFVRGQRERTALQVTRFHNGPDFSRVAQSPPR